jgi:hypothetical protein
VCLKYLYKCLFLFRQRFFRRLTAKDLEQDTVNLLILNVNLLILTAKHLIQDTAERPQVAGYRGLRAQQHLGCHVCRCACNTHKSILRHFIPIYPHSPFSSHPKSPLSAPGLWQQGLPFPPLVSGRTSPLRTS